MKLLIEKRHRSSYGGNRRPVISKKEGHGRILSSRMDETGTRVIHRHATRKTPTRSVRSLGLSH